MIKTYRSATLWPYSTKQFILWSLVGGIVGAPFTAGSTLLMAPAALTLSGTIISLFKKIFYRGQYGVTFQFDDGNDTLLWDNKQYPITSLVELRRKLVRRYGTQLQLTVMRNDTKEIIRFFSPDALTIEADICAAVQKKGTMKVETGQIMMVPTTTYTFDFK